MTVAELIAELQKMPGDAEAVITDDYALQVSAVYSVQLRWLENVGPGKFDGMLLSARPTDRPPVVVIE